MFLVHFSDWGHRGVSRRLRRSGNLQKLTVDSARNRLIHDISACFTYAPVGWHQKLKDS